MREILGSELCRAAAVQEALQVLRQAGNPCALALSAAPPSESRIVFERAADYAIVQDECCIAQHLPECLELAAAPKLRAAAHIEFVDTATRVLAASDEGSRANNEQLASQLGKAMPGAVAETVVEEVIEAKGIELIALCNDELVIKRGSLEGLTGQLEEDLIKLKKDAQEQVADVQVVIAEETVFVEKEKKETDELIVVVGKELIITEEEGTKVAIEEVEVAKIANGVADFQESAIKDLAAAEPAIMKASMESIITEEEATKVSIEEVEVAKIANGVAEFACRDHRRHLRTARCPPTQPSLPPPSQRPLHGRHPPPLDATHSRAAHAVGLHRAPCAVNAVNAVTDGTRVCLRLAVWRTRGPRHR